jgi:hypothetical protein
MEHFLRVQVTKKNVARIKHLVTQFYARYFNLVALNWSFQVFIYLYNERSRGRSVTIVTRLHVAQSGLLWVLTES